MEARRGLSSSPPAAPKLRPLSVLHQAPLAPDELAELLPLLPGGGVPSYLAQAIWVQLIPCALGTRL